MVSAHLGIGVTAAHDLAAMRAREMHARTLRWADEGADFLESLRRQPAMAAPALYGEAIGRLLVRPAELMAALVGIDPELHGCRHARHELRIENQETWIRGAVV